ETKQALEEEEKARLASDRRSAELQLIAGQRLASDGEVDRGLFTLVRGWEKTPAQDEDLHRVFRLNVAAWLPYLPRLRCYIPTSGRGLAAFSDREIVYGSGKSLWVYDAVSGEPNGTVQEFPNSHVAALSSDGRFVCLETGGKERITYRVI